VSFRHSSRARCPAAWNTVRPPGERTAKSLPCNRSMSSLVRAKARASAKAVQAPPDRADKAESPEPLGVPAMGNVQLSTGDTSRRAATRSPPATPGQGWRAAADAQRWVGSRAARTPASSGVVISHPQAHLAGSAFGRPAHGLSDQGAGHPPPPVARVDPHRHKVHASWSLGLSEDSDEADVDGGRPGSPRPTRSYPERHPGNDSTPPVCTRLNRVLLVRLCLRAYPTVLSSCR
jgi:hypothetical protein